MRHVVDPAAASEGFPDLLGGAGATHVWPGPRVHACDFHERHHLVPGSVVRQLGHDIDREFFHHHAVLHPHTPG